MRVLTLFIAALSLCACAHRYSTPPPSTQSWQDAFVLDHAFQAVGSQTTGSQTTAAVTSWLHVAVGRSVSTNINVSSFHIRSNGIVYWVACLPGDRQYPCPNITVNHRTIVSVESTTLHILDVTHSSRVKFALAGTGTAHLKLLEESIRKLNPEEPFFFIRGFWFVRCAVIVEDVV